MTITVGLPNSPLSRSALRGDTGLGRDDDDDDDDDEATSASSLTFRPSSARFPASPTSRHVGRNPPRNVSGPSTFPVRHSPMWSPDMSCPSSPPAPPSGFAQSAAARRRLSGQSLVGFSPSPAYGSLVGSYEESLLRGRMSMPASKPLTFDAELGVLGLGKCRPSLRCPPHVSFKFPAHFYDLKANAAASGPVRDASSALGSPYVGTVDLESFYFDQVIGCEVGEQPFGVDCNVLGRDGSAPSYRSASDELASFPGYRVPPKGQIQLVIKNQNLTAVKLFLIPYDLTDMPAGSKTFIRQKSMVAQPTPGSEAALAAAEAAVEGPSASPASAGGSPSLTPPTSGSIGTSAGNTASPRASALPREKLRYAVHLQFCSPPSAAPKQKWAEAGFDGLDRIGKLKASSQATAKPAPPPKIYLHKSIRVVFAARTPDRSEKLNVITETPGSGENRYTAYAGPTDEWKQALRSAKAAQRVAKERASNEDGVDGEMARRLGLGLGLASTESLSERRAASVLEDRSADADYPALPTDITVYQPNSDPNGEQWDGTGLVDGPGSVAVASRPTSRGDAYGALTSSFASPWHSSASSSSGFEGRFARSEAVHQPDLSSSPRVTSERTAADAVVPPLASVRRSSPARRPAALDTRSRSQTPTASRSPSMVRRSSAASTSSASSSVYSHAGRSSRAPLSSPTSATSTTSSEDDQALLEAWHQTWRRLPSVNGFYRAASPGSGRSTPTASRPLSPSYDRRFAPLSSASTAAPAVPSSSLGARAASPIARLRSPPPGEVAEPRLQSISVQADFDMDRHDRPPSRHNAGSVDARADQQAPRSMSTAPNSNISGGGQNSRPSLLRKLSEQFAGQLSLVPAPVGGPQVARDLSRLRGEPSGPEPASPGEESERPPSRASRSRSKPVGDDHRAVR